MKENHSIFLFYFTISLAIVGIEFGFLLVYLSGWNLGIAAVLTHVMDLLILVPLAIFICLAGLIMLNWKR